MLTCAKTKCRQELNCVSDSTCLFFPLSSIRYLTLEQFMMCVSLLDARHVTRVNCSSFSKTVSQK